MKKNRLNKTTKKEKKIPEDFLILSPKEEYESYVQQQIEQAIRFGDDEKAALYQEALEKGLKVIKHLKKGGKGSAN